MRRWSAKGERWHQEAAAAATATAASSQVYNNGNQQNEVDPLSARDDRPNEQQQQHVYKSMLSLVRYHAVVGQYQIAC